MEAKLTVTLMVIFNMIGPKLDMVGPKTRFQLKFQINQQQAGAELGQAQPELGLKVWV